jgi:hypothetical protein
MNCSTVASIPNLSITWANTYTTEITMNMKSVFPHKLFRSFNSSRLCLWQTSDYREIQSSEVLPFSEADALPLVEMVETDGVVGRAGRYRDSYT